MPTSQTPLLLLDNLLDTIVQYPTAILTPSSESSGREAMRVASYRRERQWWQPTSAGEINHLDASTNTPGASTGRWLKGIANFIQANTSHTFGFYFRSGDPATTQYQTLAYFAGAATFSLHRVGNNNRLGFYDGAFKDFGPGSTAPTDGAWHTIIFKFDAAGSLAFVYVDGVQVGSSVAWTGAGISVTIASAQKWSLLGGIDGTQNIVGKLARAVYYSGAAGTASLSTTVAQIHAGLTGSTAMPATGLVSDWNASVDLRGNSFSDTVGGRSLQLGTNAGDDAASDPIWGGGHSLIVDLGAGNTAAPDALWLDRGNNWPSYIVVGGGDDGIFWYDEQIMVAPALGGTLGTDPTLTARSLPAPMALTEEGAAYALFAAMTPRRYWRIRFPYNGTIPQITGLIVGARTQLLGYSSIADDDEGGRKLRTEESDAGYVATGRVYAYRTAQLGLSTIGDTEYDAGIRKIRQAMFERGCPALLCLNYGFYPSRAWLFQSTDTKWSMPKKTIYRDGRLMLREVGAAVL